jgi:hypothetical protein
MNALLVFALLQTTFADAAQEGIPSGDIEAGDVDGPADQDGDQADLVEDEPQPDPLPALPAPAAAVTPPAPDGGPPPRRLELDEGQAEAERGLHFDCTAALRVQRARRHVQRPGGLDIHVLSMGYDDSRRWHGQ